MRKVARTRDMLKVLHDLGFSEVLLRGSHIALQHAETGLVVSLPAGRNEVPIAITMSIVRQLENYGIASRQEFQQFLDAA